MTTLDKKTTANLLLIVAGILILASIAYAGMNPESLTF
jgi:hypothetical protein